MTYGEFFDYHSARSEFAAAVVQAWQDLFLTTEEAYQSILKYNDEHNIC